MYKVGGKIISKKKHACGSKEWTVERLGADIKLKCALCGRVIFLSHDEVKKMALKYEEVSSDDVNP